MQGEKATERRLAAFVIGDGQCQRYFLGKCRTRDKAKLAKRLRETHTLVLFPLMWHLCLPLTYTDGRYALVSVLMRGSQLDVIAGTATQSCHARWRRHFDDTVPYR